MAAAAFKVSMKVVNAKNPNQYKTFYLTGSDVNAAALAFESGGTEMSLAPFDCLISDMMFAPTYGTDTTTVTPYIGGIAAGVAKIINAANQSTTIGRQLQQAPIFVPAGAMVKFIQNT